MCLFCNENNSKWFLFFNNFYSLDLGVSIMQSLPSRTAMLKKENFSKIAFPGCENDSLRPFDFAASITVKLPIHCIVFC